ncbi:MAG: SWIM zinc finger domain-containing protein [Candidatus Aminicenantes bacterium]
MKNKSIKKSPFAALTWQDLESWVGVKTLSRGKAYQKSSAVQDLALAGKTRLIAWVQGTKRYATEVEIIGGEPSSGCTCPVGIDCKHGVAVLLEYREALKQDREVPQIDPEDPRLTLLDEAMEGDEDDFLDEYDEQADHDFIDDEYGYDSKSPEEGSQNRPESKGRVNLRAFLRNKSREDLIALVEELATTHAGVRQDLWIWCSLAAGQFKELVQYVRKEIDVVTAEEAWYDRWRQQGSLPDYSGVRDGLKQLLDAGRADDVLALGKRLFKRAHEQVSMSHDEGETAMEVADIMKIVYQALLKCSLSDAEKMETAVNFELEDEFDLFCESEIFWKHSFPREAWKGLADRLLGRLESGSGVPGRTLSESGYKRTILSNHVIQALRKAGRDSEIIPLCEREAKKAGSYERLVELLMKKGRLKEAETWIRKGIADVGEKWPGIGAALRKRLGEIMTKQGDWAYAAALITEDFFDRPSLHLYKELKKMTSKQGEAWKYIREALREFLDKGKCPQQGTGGWPLPDTGLARKEEEKTSRPAKAEVRIEIALFEKEIDRALSIYKAETKSLHTYWGWGGALTGGIHDEVAQAVAKRYPDEALTIWKRLVKGLIAQTKPAAYRSAVPYLKKIRALLERTGRKSEWDRFLNVIRVENARKRKLLEILDGLEAKPLIES